MGCDYVIDQEQGTMVKDACCASCKDQPSTWFMSLLQMHAEYRSHIETSKYTKILFRFFKHTNQNYMKTFMARCVSSFSWRLLYKIQLCEVVGAIFVYFVFKWGAHRLRYLSNNVQNFNCLPFENVERKLHNLRFSIENDWFYYYNRIFCFTSTELSSCDVARIV